MSDLQNAVLGLVSKKRLYDKYWRYYDGDQPLIYNSEKLKEIFSGLDARFTQNWCAVVVDSVLDRLDLRTPVVTDDQAGTQQLAELWETTGIVDDVASIHEDVAVTGESFVIAWPGEDDEIQAFHNDARLCYVEYDGANPRKIRYAAKWWRTEDNKVRITLYYADRLEYYISKRDYKEGEVSNAKAFQPLSGLPVAENPFGIVPVFHFRANQRAPKSQLSSVIEMQDAVNKLVSDMMVAAEFGAFPQRWVISGGGIENLRTAPNEIWDLVSADEGLQPTSAGQFAATSLDNYVQTINKLSADIGIITRTPRHYFYAQGGDPSGEALIAMEAPLVKKIGRLQGTLQPTWRDLAAFLLSLRKIVVKTRSIYAAYEPANTIQPVTQATIHKLNVEASMPLRTSLKTYEGWTEEDIAEMDADMEAERVAQASFADAVLSQAQRQFDQGTAV